MKKLISIILLLAVNALATTYNIGPGKTYTNVGDAPWSTMAAGDVVNIYPKTALTATTSGTVTAGTSITLTGSAGSIPFGATLWFSGMTQIAPYVTCGVYGSGLYGTSTAGTACSGSAVTVSENVTIPNGTTIYLTPPYFEKIIMSTQGSSGSPFIVQGVPDPTTGALPVIDAHNATTGPNMAHFGSAVFHDFLGLVLFMENSGKTQMATYVTLKYLRVQNAASGLTNFDGANASYTLGSGVANIRFEDADNVTISNNEIVNGDNGTFGAENPTTNPAFVINSLILRSNHYFRNGSASSFHQSYVEANGATYELNWFDQPKVSSSCSQLKDRSSASVIRYNLVYPSARVLDIVDSQNGRDVLVPQVALTVPVGGFTSGATTLIFSTSVTGINVGDRVGYINATVGWGYPGSNNPVMPTVASVNTGTKTLTLDSPGIPASLAAGQVVNVISRQLNSYQQTFVYGNVFDIDETLYSTQISSVVHYGWDTANGIDSVYDRAGTLYFYHNTVIYRWDQSAQFFSHIFQAESNADIISAFNNLWYVIDSSGSVTPTYFNLMQNAGYGGPNAVGVFSGSGNQMATSAGIGSNTCASITESGWSVCTAAGTGLTVDASGITSKTATQLYPSSIVGSRDYNLQVGSSAIGNAVSLPAAITSNTLGGNFTPLYQYGGAVRSNINDIGAYKFTPIPRTVNHTVGGGRTIQ